MSMRCPNTWQGVVLWSTVLKKNRSGPESAGWMFTCCLNRQRAIFLLHSCASVQLLCIYKLYKLSRTHYIHETKAFSWIPLHKKSGRIDQSRRAPRESEGCWERERERTAGRNWKQDQIYGCLFNRAIQLHYPRQNINRESDVERRSITQVFLFCATTGETMTSGKCSAHPVALFLFTVIHAHSIPFNSPCFFPVVFSLPASLSSFDSVSLFAVLLRWADAIQRANVTEREKCFVILLLASFFHAWAAFVMISRGSAAPSLFLSLFHSQDSIPKVYGLKWDV